MNEIVEKLQKTGIVPVIKLTERRLNGCGGI